ncbi:protein of unknown function [Methylacidimicrobium sp. AP8]|nr:protein of unknown function [Methylacidimicrobium sp. AP8]
MARVRDEQRLLGLSRHGMGLGLSRHGIRHGMGLRPLVVVIRPPAFSASLDPRFRRRKGRRTQRTPAECWRIVADRANL